MTFRNNEFNFGVLPLLQRHGIRAHCGRYEGSADAAKYKAMVRIPTSSGRE